MMHLQGSLSIERMCALAQVSRASYYRSLAETAPEEEEMQVRVAIQEIVLEHRRRYGYRRVQRELRDRGLVVNHKRVARLMRADNLLAIRGRRFVVTTDSDHELEVYVNLAARMQPTAPDQLWVADITYVRLRGEFVYLAVVLDAFSRRVLGWYVDRTLHSRLATTALEQAIAERQPLPGVVHHSDRGVQYASTAYVKILEKHGLIHSMSRPGNPYDNAMCESFMKTLKQEEIYCTEYKSLEHLRQNIGDFIRNYYNRRRLHSALGYRSPEAFEADARRQPASLASAPKMSFRRHTEIYPSDGNNTEEQERTR
jgi:transposase InsO family protein